MTIRAVYRKGQEVLHADTLRDGGHIIFDRRRPDETIPFAVEGNKVTFDTGGVREPEDMETVFEGVDTSSSEGKVTLSVERHDRPLGPGSEFGVPFTHRFYTRERR